MALPLNLTVKMGSYLVKQKLLRRKKFPLIVEVEPLFACNLACNGCGKIQHPAGVLKQRMPVAQVIGAVEECGAPMVSLAGGEPLMHPQIHTMAAELLSRGKFVVLCTNAVLLPKHLHKAKAAGFAVYTNSTFFNNDSPQDVIEVLDYLNNDLKVDRMEISPGYAYEKAPDQDRFLGVEQTRRLFKKAFSEGRRRRWRLNHSELYLDFLEGRTDFECTPWAIPSYSLFGWQKPCYLMADGYAATYQELLETTDWDKYGRGKDPRCDNCMAHCGYEPTAVLATMGSLRQSLRAVTGG